MFKANNKDIRMTPRHSGVFIVNFEHVIAGWEGVKSDSYLPKNVSYLLDWKPFKNDENVFYFNLKALSVLKIFKFLSRLLKTTRKNGLIRKIRLTSKFITSQPDLQTIAIHILPNISQSKGNQTMKFGQLIEYNKRNIFLQKLCRKWGKETSSRPLFIF